MWLPNDIILQVDQVALIYYIDVNHTKRWNTYRKENELRLLTGWAWVSKVSGAYRYGFKTKTVAYRDAYYTLVLKTSQPVVTVRVQNRKRANER